jgi:hypothetical protein
MGLSGFRGIERPANIFRRSRAFAWLLFCTLTYATKMLE